MVMLTGPKQYPDFVTPGLEDNHREGQAQVLVCTGVRGQYCPVQHVAATQGSLLHQLYLSTHCFS